MYFDHKGDIISGTLVEGDTIKMYYGVADTSIACAEFSIKEVLDSLK